MSLVALLDRQLVLMDELTILLKRELDTLMTNPIDGAELAALASAKQSTLTAIATLEDERRQSLAREGVEDEPSGMAEAARAAGCLPQWQALLDLARSAHHLNLLNGSLINQRMAHNRQVLAALQQLVGNPLYGVDGQTQRRGTGLTCKA